MPTDFAGVAELGLIAGVGMVIAFACTMTFLPATLTLFRPRAERAEVGFAFGNAAEDALFRARRPVLAAFALVAAAGVLMLPRLAFDSDPLHTKNTNTEAMRTLNDLRSSPLTNPYSIDVLAPNLADADMLAGKIAKLPLVANTLTLSSFVPNDQKAKLAQIADAADVLAATIAPRTAAAPVKADELRLAATAARKQIEHALPKLAKDDPLVAIARRSAGAGDGAGRDADGGQFVADPLPAAATGAAADGARRQAGDRGRHSAGHQPRLDRRPTARRG